MSVSKILVRIAPKAYPVYIGSGVLARLPRFMTRAGLERRAVVVSDRRLAHGIAAKVARTLKDSGFRVDTFALPMGERAKSLTEIRRLYGFMLRAKVERRTSLVAVGGGTVGDAAGFAAATYYRGIPLVHVPTTLLAQVDSAIGGKTAVNHPLSKNAIGAFYQPALVAADTDTLKSLPKTEILAGLAEVVKYALVFDRAFARRLDADWRKILRGNAAARERMIRRCVQWKARIVAADERDLSGRRELLNFGHTLGHALESATGFLRFRHGEAVAWGMRGALALSENRGFLSIHDGALAKRLLSRLPKVRRPKGATPAKILRALRGDKKVVDDKNVFILLKRLAAPVRVDNVSRREILRVLSELP